MEWIIMDKWTNEVIGYAYRLWTAAVTVANELNYESATLRYIVTPVGI